MKHSLLSLSLLVSATLSIVAAEKPNIVILFSDDAGYADFGFQPNCADDMKHLTPNINTIAQDGVHFTNAYMTASICSPSRAGLMTGRYQQRFGYDNNLPSDQKQGLPLSETFGAKRLQDLGYKTALVGKWHLGYPEEMQPNKRGFDWFYGILQGGRGYFPIEGSRRGGVVLENTTPTKEAGYLTDRFGAAACKFITENKEHPFFLFVSFTSPHSPNQPKEEDMKRTAHIKDEQRAAYAGLIVSLDDNIGKILAQLKKEKLDNNTLVIFMNDNGGQTRTGGNNSPLSGKKGSLLEGGIRVPWAMRWHGNIQPGSMIHDPIISLDLIPTLIEVAGSESKPEWKLDGRSILARITGKVNSLPTRPLFWRQNGTIGDRSLREGNWKIHHQRSSGGPPKLYNLHDDIGEKNDLSTKHPDIFNAMMTKLNQWESELLEPLWGGGHNGQPIERKGGRKNGSRR